MLNEEPNILLDYDPGYGGSCNNREHWTKEQSDRESKRQIVDRSSYWKGYDKGVDDAINTLRSIEDEYIDLQKTDKPTLEKLKSAVKGTSLEEKITKALERKK